ncbi:family 43 glycosylhydrolase [Paenibacillus sp. B2(2019)]|uniref:family 43 glycosylhydrolase n=1 Tax=Paenibacillus sp. B2(2019) TaxID=2607754 RepID=UPI0011F2B456|nr:family 43 glycosylhydrolase [Paenibacillus sp. B2(2019)]KAA1178494.1 family 43 glycosylhydrolase [Paenibacillus sp. B2(2019)]
METNYGPDRFSSNPLLPCNEYIPDGEPYVFGDRLYLYGSHDLFGSGEFCGGDYVTWSAPVDNLSDWRYEGVIYKKMQDPFVKKMVNSGKKGMMKTNMFAPDIVEIEGKYYLYYGIGLSKSGFGVAVSDSPVGPFEYIGRVRYPESEKPKNWKDGRDGIEDGDYVFGKGKGPLLNMASYPYDPSVIYDNGRLYMYFGLCFCHVVELDTNDMRTVIKNEKTGHYISESLIPSMFTQRSKRKDFDGMGMLNGPSIRKINDVFYLVYYGTGPNKCNAMCYATSKSPFGPFEYGGILVSLGNSRYKGQNAPTEYVGNTHGGMVHLNGTWYIIYHRHTSNQIGGRQAMVAALTMRPDGNFEHAEHHSMGFSKSALPAYYQWPAFMACYLTDAQGKTKAKTNSPYILQRELAFGLVDDHSGKKVFQVVTNTTSGSVVGYKYFDFGHEARENTKVILSILAESNGYVEIFVDNPISGELIAKVQVEISSEYTDFLSPLKAITGEHAVYFVFHPEGKTLGDLSHFAFM